MSSKKRLLNNGVGKIFSPTVFRSTNAASHVFNSAVNNYSFNSFKDTNLDSTSSFRYGDKEGLTSTQELNIDYSNFTNHTFFHSAVAKTNEAFDQIVNKFPFDGSNRQIEAFEDSLTGFEKYILDSFPKNVGYLNFSGSSSTSPQEGNYIIVKDAAGLNQPGLSNNSSNNALRILDPRTSDFMVQFHMKIPQESNGNQIIFQKRLTLSNNLTVGLSSAVSSTQGTIFLGVTSGSRFNYVETSVPKGSFFHFTGIHHASSDQRLKIVKIESGSIISVVSSSNQVEFNDLNYDGNDLVIGSGSQVRVNNSVFTPSETFSGSIDDLRFFKTVHDVKKIDTDKDRSVNGSENLFLYFKFNEPQGDYSGKDLVLDSSGYSFNSRVENFIDSNRITGSDVPMLAEKQSHSPVLFPDFPEVLSLHSRLITSGTRYDTYNPNMITKLVPQHYFDEGNAAESFTNVLGKISSDFNKLTGVRSNPNSVTSAQLLVTFLLTWAKFFDEVKLFVDNFSLFFVDYDNKDTVADKLLPSLSKFLGIPIPKMFKYATADQLFDGIDLEREASKAALSLTKIQNLIWRRILSDSTNIKLSRGSLDSIFSVFRSSGIEPENIFHVREYGGSKKRSLESSTENKKDVISFLSFSGSIDHRNESTDSQGRSSTSPHLKSSFLSASRIEIGFPLQQGSFVNKSQYPPHGISDNVSDGLLTSGSFTFQGNYLFPLGESHSNQQSLFRLHVTGTDASVSSEACVLNLVNDQSSEKLSLFFNDSKTSSTINELYLTGINIVDGDRWSINFGRKCSSEINSSTRDVYFLRASKFFSGRVFDTHTTSSAYTVNSDSVLSNISSENTSGSFICIGSQSFGSSTNFVNAGSTKQKQTYFSGRVSYLNFWSKSTKRDDFEVYAKNPNAVGSRFPIRNYNFTSHETGSFERLRIQTSGKQSTTGSDSSGEIRLFDFTQNELHIDGFGFESNKAVMKPFYVIYEMLSSRFDINSSRDKVRLRTIQDADLLRFHEFASVAPANEIVNANENVDDNRFSIDMSVMKGLDENIMTMFSTFEPIDDALGRPSLLFSDRYPDLINYQKLFFNNVLEKLELGKYRELFKWIDNSYSDLVFSLLPRSTNFMGINFIYESHVLERHRLLYNYDEIYYRTKKRLCSESYLNEFSCVSDPTIPGNRIDDQPPELEARFNEFIVNPDPY